MSREQRPNYGAGVKYFNSFGNGYGINRNTGGARSLPTAVPPLASVRVRPGSGYSRADIGQQGLPFFQGAKVISGHKGYTR